MCQSQTFRLCCTEFVPDEIRRPGHASRHAQFWENVGELAKKHHHILLPANINFNHWVLLWLFGLPDHPKVLVFDSIWQTKSSLQVSGHVVSMVKSLSERALGRETPIFSSYIPSPQQPDMTQCGLYMVHNMQQVATNFGRTSNIIEGWAEYDDPTSAVLALAEEVYQQSVSKHNMTWNRANAKRSRSTTQSSKMPIMMPQLSAHVISCMERSIVRNIETKFEEARLERIRNQD